MIYTSACFANTEHTQVTGTDANGNTETVPHDYTLFRQPDDGPIGFVANGGVILPFVPYPIPAYRLYKSTLIRRLTETEAVALTALLKSSPVKMQMLWDASEYLVSDDPLFDDLTMAISGALGEDRASEILGEDK